MSNLPTSFNINRIQGIPGPQGLQGLQGPPGVSGGTPTFILDPGSAALVVGDWVAPLPSDPLKVTKATIAAVRAAQSVVGCVASSYAPGAVVTVQAIGTVVSAVAFSDLGAGTACDIQLNAVARAVRQPQVSGGEILLGSVDANGNVTVRPNVQANTAARRAYNPKSYGAVFDGIVNSGGGYQGTDDLDAWNAMFADMRTHAPNAPTGYMVEIPIGRSYVRDTIVIDQCLVINGHAGGGNRALSGIVSPAGVTPLQVSNGNVIPNSGLPAPRASSDGSYSAFYDLSLNSTELVPQHANTYSLTCGVSAHRAINTAYSVGNCVVDLSSANIGNGGSTRGYFLRVTANTGDHKTSGAAESTLRDVATGTRAPAAAIAGDVFVDGNVTWTAEAFVGKRIRNTALRMGDRVLNVGADRCANIPTGALAQYADADENRYYFEVVTAGTTANSTAPVGYDQPAIGGLITDGTCQLRVKVHTCMLVCAPHTTVDRVTVAGCTNWAVKAYGIVGLTNADLSTFDNITCLRNIGGGVDVGSDEAQGISVRHVEVNFAGICTPGDTQNTNNGGHSYYSHSQGGESVRMVYGQFGFGRNLFCPFAQTGGTSFQDCFSENSLADQFSATTKVHGGTRGAAPITGIVAPLILDVRGGYGRGLTEHDYGGSVAVGRGLTSQDGSVGAGSTLDWWTIATDAGASQLGGWHLMFQRPTSAFNPFATGTGWTARLWKSANGSGGIGRGYSQNSATQGPGFEREYLGFFKGLEGGTIAWHGLVSTARTDALTWKQIRAGTAGATPGMFTAGDTWEYLDNSAAGTWRFQVATSAGRRGLARVDAHQYYKEGPADFAADVVQTGVKNFVCTTSGISTTGAPAGYGTAIVGGTVTDGAAVFTRVADSPTYANFGWIEDGVTGQTCQTSTAWKDTAGTDATATCPKEYVLSYRFQALTTTNTANQTLFAIPSFPDNSTVTITYQLDGKRNGNHASYAASEGKQKAGRNNGAGPEFATGAYSNDAWGAENSLTGSTFDVVTDGANGALLRFNNPPAYQVDIGGAVQVNVRIA